MLTVHLAGLIYLDACPDEENACRDRKRQALVPDGTTGDMNMQPHFASLWVEMDDYDSADWWPDATRVHALEVPSDDGRSRTKVVLEFRIPEPAMVTFPDDKADAEVVDIGKELPKLKAKGFELADNPQTIATIPIRGGRLAPRTFGECGIVQWTIDKHDELTITAQSGNVRKSVKLREPDPNNLSPAKSELGVEVVFANAPDFVSSSLASKGAHGNGHHGHMPSHGLNGRNAIGSRGNGDHLHHNHFMLYGKLDKRGDGHKFLPLATRENLSKIAEGRPVLRFDHALLRFLIAGDEIPGAPCTPSCCP